MLNPKAWFISHMILLAMLCLSGPATAQPRPGGSAEDFVKWCSTNGLHAKKSKEAESCAEMISVVAMVLALEGGCLKLGEKIQNVEYDALTKGPPTHPIVKAAFDWLLSRPNYVRGKKTDAAVLGALMALHDCRLE